MQTAKTPAPITIVDVDEQLVVGTRQQLKQALLKHLAAGEDVILDFSKTRYIDSSGLGVLVHVREDFQRWGRRLALCRLNADLVVLFELTKLDTLFDVHADRDQARAALEAA